MSFALQARMKEIETVFARVVELQKKVELLEKQVLVLRETVQQIEDKRGPGRPRLVG
jgi:predicted  nucleic acid-binding Zn-ribbon protein